MNIFPKLALPKKMVKPVKPLTGRPGDAVQALMDPQSALAEAFRTVRTNLQFAAVEQKRKSILVTSAAPGEGKSTTTANLGVTMTQAGLRVLLVDSDLRRSTLHKIFTLPNTAGLTTVLTGQTPLASTTQATRLPKLFVLTSGPTPPNPAEMLMSSAMADLSRKVEADFDLVLYDSPPIISVADALVLAGLLESVLLVVRAGGYPQELINQAKTQIEGVKAKILGILLNSVDFKRDGYYYRYYYYYYYGYGYGDGRK